MSRAVAAITSVASAVTNVFAFIDGTGVDVCRPKNHREQEALYSGKDRVCLFHATSHTFNVAALHVRELFMIALLPPRLL